MASPCLALLGLISLLPVLLSSSTNISSSSSSRNTTTSPPPLPLLPIPTAKQLRWQRRERSLFFHFGMNTFTDSEWGSGHDDPSVFTPGLQFNTRQWVGVAKDAGFNLVILTAKHHDGFCLWPSKYTNYSVRTSPWRNGAGDVVSELVDAAREAGIEVGLYLSPWDRHELSYGDTLNYNKFYLAQLRELLTNYGSISEIWLDGAKGANATSMDYKFDEWFQVIQQLQPNAMIFSDAGPDTRWVGDEQGQAGSTCWSMVQRSNIQIGNAGASLQYLNQGDAYGADWVPPECDVSIRPGWFWHGSEHPKDVWTLLDTYYKSVGRNCVLLLNVPPNVSGLISDEDAKILRSFNTALSSIFSMNLAASATSVTASSTLSSTYNPRQVLKQNTSSFWSPEEGQGSAWLLLDQVDVWFQSRGWITLAKGTTIGYKRLHRIQIVTRANVVKLVIVQSRAAPPLIAFFGLYLDPYPRVYNSTS